MTTMEINLSNLKYNLNQIKNKLNNDTNIIAMVKADAYGLGDIEICKTLIEENIHFFGVAHTSEAINLRKNNINDKILVVGQFLEQDIKDIVDYDISICIANLNYLEALNNYALSKNKIIKGHLKIDTGMSRLGFLKNELDDVILKLKQYSNIQIVGIFTHLSSADTDEKYTLSQINQFDSIVNGVKTKISTLEYVHCLNSSGIVNFPDFQYNTVRVGDILYGYYPDENLRTKISLKPCVKIISTICNITTFTKGTAISYSQNHILEKDTKVATVQMGYADGLFRNLSNKYSINIKGKKCKILGNICMDMFMCDVSEVEDLSIGDIATIIDYDNSIYDMCSIAGTINYEIISRISKRVTRKYIKNN